jgi:hypothetical protein
VAAVDLAVAGTNELDVDQAGRRHVVLLVVVVGVFVRPPPGAARWRPQVPGGGARDLERVV